MTFSEVLAKHNKDPKVMLAGDWHGNTSWAKKKIQEASKTGHSLILQLGDTAIWPGHKGERFLQSLTEKCQLHDVDLFLVLGNHEDWPRLEKAWESHRDHKGQPLPFEIVDRVWVLPKGYKFTLNGVSFLSLGGAASVDFDVRKRGKDWWPQEMISWTDVENGLACGEVDVMLTHEAPDEEFCVPEVQRILRDNPNGYRPEGLAYSAVSRSRVTEVLLNAKPTLLAHGHMHVFDERVVRLPKNGKSTHILSLDKDKHENNLWSLDLSNFRENYPKDID